MQFYPQTDIGSSHLFSKLITSPKSLITTLLNIKKSPSHFFPTLLYPTNLFQFMNSRRFFILFADRTVLIWDVKNLTQKDRKSLRVNVDFDHPTNVKWSPDSRAFIISRYHENTIEVYKLDKKTDSWIGHASKAFMFPKVCGTPRE